jgi:formyltetrahydrofolate deformylase
MTTSAILLMHCPDQIGLVAAVTDFIQKNSGNILHLDQHVDDRQSVFFMRIEWDLAGFAIPRDKIGEFFKVLIGDKFNMTWELHFSDARPRMAIFVSQFSHCLYDILARWHSEEWQVDIPLVLSNHETLRPVVEQFGLPFVHVPITAVDKPAQEAHQHALLQEHNVDFIVLARYMQILSDEFVSHYPNRIINIHHSFLPAFAGARPYHSAYKRGVKLIGATSHYVTAVLDAGPIIEQDVVRVNHRHTIEDLTRKGRDLEKVVLSRAIHHHLRHRILVYDNRTLVFS